ncbi:hypothetical protein BU23DRAFT_575235 [Bimuria novae-zelandiae CBS 107.79]|uniref:Uncharacterized protein n=1 Tax=Bimuria novae-zelandiae CBS 107.79 TaxID=1447943 RepID=A0A6A5UL15_9PLEO|nr:hypothetical protein BU23DRAFT_575235 [Bimuria novae-zelandiae CBS 107.79]
MQSTGQILVRDPLPLVWRVTDSQSARGDGGGLSQRRQLGSEGCKLLCAGGSWGSWEAAYDVFKKNKKQLGSNGPVRNEKVERVARSRRQTKQYDDVRSQPADQVWFGRMSSGRRTLGRLGYEQVGWSHTNAVQNCKVTAQRRGQQRRCSVAGWPRRADGAGQ